MQQHQLIKTLLVDPDPVERDTLAMFLEDMGCQIHIAGTLDEVRTLPLTEGFCVAIMEWGVPGLEGPALARLLGAGLRPVFLFTHQDLIRIRPEAAGCGFTAMVDRHRRSELLMAVRKIIADRWAGERGLAGLAADQGLPTGQPLDTEAREVLIIDDSPTMRRFLRRTVEGYLTGCVVTESDDGGSAMIELYKHPFCLIITDLQMPGMDGLTFLRQLRKNSQMKGKPVVVFSSMATPQMRQWLQQDPLVRLVGKTSNPDQVLHAIRELVLNVETPHAA